MICESKCIKKQDELPKNTKFFPECEDVFIEEQSWLKDHFLPLYSLDLGELNKEFSGHVIHVVNPFEPYSECIGVRTKEFHNEFSHENWFAFQIKDDGKYEFLGNEGFFEYHTSVHDIPTKIALEFATKHFNSAKEAYLKSKQHYQETGKVSAYSDWKDAFFDTSSFGSFGGMLTDENWTSAPPSAFKIYGDGLDDWIGTSYGEVSEELKPYYDDRFYLVSYKNKPFYQVGWIDSFINNTPSCPIILYEPENKIVLYTFQWT